MRRIAPVLAAAIAACSLTVAHAADYEKMTDVRVSMDDGVVLTADVYAPTGADQDGDGLYPCVVELTPYRKENRAAEGASFLPSQGIALIEVDARGTGGSNGEYDVVFSIREQRDMAQWVDWAATTAKKPNGSKLCETTVGTYGGSYSGIIQYLAASLPLVPGDAGYGRLPLGSQYLSAIAPQRAYGDLYRDIVYHGGVVIGSFGNIWSAGTTAYYSEPPTDMPGAQAASAWSDHMTRNDPLIVNYLNAPYADASFTDHDFSQKLYEDSSILSRIENLRVPTLHLAGEFDAFTRGQLRTFTEAYSLENAAHDRGPNFLILGPWNHSGTHFINPDQGFKVQLGEWYRYWLEGRANGATTPEWIASGPRVRYFQTRTGIANAQSATDGEWKTAISWPPAGVTAETMSFAPTNSAGAGSYSYAPTSGKAETWSRWDNAAGVPVPQQQLDQRLENEGLTWSSGELQSDLEVTGPISVHLVAGTTGPAGNPSLATSWPGALQLAPPYHDTDWIVKVSDVAPDGTAILVTQGYLRASHAALDPSKSQFLDGTLIAPYHPHTAGALRPPPADGTLRAYEIEVWPVAKTWVKGHRIRIDVSSADTPNHLALAVPALNTIDPASTITLPIAHP